MTPNPIYRELALKVGARHRCRKEAKGHWLERHLEDIRELMRNTAPSGSGIDCGTKIDMERSTDEKLVFDVSFHHMDDHGYYDGWTQHTITVRPSLWNDIDIRISGRNRNDIKEYLHQVYDCWLRQSAPKPVPVPVPVAADVPVPVAAD